MKKFMEFVVEWKSTAGLMFSGSVIVCAVIMLFFGNDSIPIIVLTSMLIISFAGTFLQHLAFTDRIIKKLPYSLRMAVFAIPFFALLAVNAWFFNWFPVAETIHWLTFTTVYLVVFIGGTISFEIYFHLMGKKYDGLLGQYRRQKEFK